ncbi:MAG: hypothetical protein IJZ75_07730 [Clostridia bacterium]|nr:hypothetical protein [Clostridia bacterium]
MPKDKDTSQKSKAETIKEIKENIGAAAEKVGAKINEPVEKYGNAVANNLGLIIKTIAFVVAFAIIILTFLAAFLVFSKQPLYIAISLGIVILGTVIAAITLFLIYGLGHLIIQNNEILKRLRDLKK